MTPSRGGDREHDFEFLPEVLAEARELPEDVRRVLARLVVELHADPYRGDPMDDRPPRVLQGCRKVRFDRYRLVYRVEPSDGVVVLAIGERRNLIAYANAAARSTRRAAGDQLRRRP